MNAHFILSDRIKKRAYICITVFAALLLLYFARDIAADALMIVIGASVICFLTDPVARFFEQRMKRSHAVLCALLSCFFILGVVLFLLLPTVISEGSQLLHVLPQSISIARAWLESIMPWFEKQFPGIRLPSSAFTDKALPALATGTFRFATNIADLFYHFSLMVVLSYFFLCDKERILILLELLIPRSVRRTAVLMGNSICRELKNYLRSQSIIAAAVGLLTTAGLAIVGIDSAIVLGIIVGILNMIPYFGPIIGAVPAVMAAMGSGLQAALITVAVLWIVQQIDSTLISPRIMSSQTGVSPAVVLLSIFIGSQLGGIAGMLFALPVVITIRTLFRVFVQRYENV